MGRATRRRLLAGALLLFAAWPPVHMFLARRYRTDPWSLFGWGMYAMPKPVVEVDLGEIGPSGRPWPAEVREAAERWRERRRVFGDLAAPEPLAAQVLAQRPELAGVAMRVRRLSLDPRSARFVVAEQLLACRRPSTEPADVRCGPLDAGRVVP